VTAEAGPETEWLEAGDAALRRGEWQTAREAFQAALDLNESAHALEGFGRATWWLDDLDATFPARQRAFQLYREEGDDRGAARVALSLSIDYVDVLGEPSVGFGWLQRSASLLEGLELSPDHGWHKIYSGFFRVEVDGDYAGGLRLAQEAQEIGRQLKVFDLEMLGAAGEGYCRLRAGEVMEGLRLMDEATAAAISGEISDLTVAGATCCALMYSCSAIADYERAFHWSVRAKELCKRWGLRSFFSICRVHYASNFISRGDWAMAEEELVDLLDRPGTTRPATLEDATMKLAELRRKQGRFEEAEALYARAPHKPLAIIGGAHIALQRDNDPVAAADLVDRFLRRIGDEDRAERAFALELLIEARLRMGAFEAAAACAPEIDSLAILTGTLTLKATSRRAEAQLWQARGDLDMARRSFEDAIDLYGQAGLPLEAAIARRSLSRVLQGLSRIASARREARAAFEAFRTLGARFEADLALQTLRGLEEDAGADAVDNSSGLSRREVEVLALIAQGRGNPEIADELVLSVRTVERHISSIYEKLGLSGASARASATAYALANGLARRG
jgi:DNA-binding CsgD family transcriptional regulator